jgi:hypothetical protein
MATRGFRVFPLSAADSSVDLEDGITEVSEKEIGSPTTPDCASASATIWAVTSAASSGDIVYSSNGDSPVGAASTSFVSSGSTAFAANRDAVFVGFESEVFLVKGVNLAFGDVVLDLVASVWIGIEIPKMSNTKKNVNNYPNSVKKHILVDLNGLAKQRISSRVRTKILMNELSHGALEALFGFDFLTFLDFKLVEISSEHRKNKFISDWTQWRSKYCAVAYRKLGQGGPLLKVMYISAFNHLLVSTLQQSPSKPSVRPPSRSTAAALTSRAARCSLI